MIAQDLKCRRGHQFEAWFKDLKTFESQRGGGLIECPRCGDSGIEMVYRPRAIKKKGALAGGGDVRRSARALEAFLRENFEDVGTSFAGEALKVHRGECEPRNLRGETTAREEAELLDEGVPFLKIATPKPSN